MAYPEAKKAEVLALLAANGGNVNETARQASVPETTLRQWRNGQGVNNDIRVKARAEKENLADQCEDLARLLLGDMAKASKRQKAGLAPLAMAFGVAVDKMRLLRGESTAVVEVRDDGTIFSLLLPEAAPGRAQEAPGAPDEGGEGGASLPLAVLGEA